MPRTVATMQFTRAVRMQAQDPSALQRPICAEELLHAASRVHEYDVKSDLFLKEETIEGQGNGLSMKDLKPDAIESNALSKQTCIDDTYADMLKCATERGDGNGGSFKKESHTEGWSEPRTSKSSSTHMCIWRWCG